MPRTILSLSGWGQKSDSLESIFDSRPFEEFSIRSFDYSTLNSTDSFFSSIKSLKLDPEILIGWSLGGQLAIRLIEKKIINPKLLILIAPPFQMVKDKNIQAGMSRDTFDVFYNNFVKAPGKTLKQFSILTAMNDKNASEIARTLDISDKNNKNLQFWLEELNRFSCFNVDFKNMPRTLFFHGAGDMITHISQSGYFQERIKDFRLEVFKNCGHAPHLNNIEKLRESIFEEISKCSNQSQNLPS